MAKFRVGITRDFLRPDGKFLCEDIGLSLFNRIPDLEWEVMPEYRPLIAPEQIKDYDAIISLAPRYTADSLIGVERLAVIARCGVGYDNVDIEACTRANVMVFIARGAVNRPVAEGILTLMLSISHNLLVKDRLVRSGSWADRVFHMGCELRDRVVGSVGLGGIAGELFRLLRGFGTRRSIAYDPYCEQSRAESLGVELVPLDLLLSESDFVVINCPLTQETRRMIGPDQLALMKPTAFLINTARGGIVDQKALTEFLQQRRIRGAALDVFEQEPLSVEDPLTRLDNVILTPHSIAWTEEAFRDMGRMDCEGILRVYRGEVPDHVVNPEVLSKPEMQRKLRRFREQHQKASAGL